MTTVLKVPRWFPLRVLIDFVSWGEWQWMLFGARLSPTQYGVGFELGFGPLNIMGRLYWRHHGRFGK